MSASSSSQARRQSRQTSHRSRRSAAWEDDAWKIDSDDEDFVKASRSAQQQQQLARGANGGAQTRRTASQAHASQSLADEDVAAGIEALSLGHNKSSNQASTSTAADGRGARSSSITIEPQKQPGMRQAPPARPHPFASGEPTRQGSQTSVSSLRGSPAASSSSPRGNSAVDTVRLSSSSNASTPTAGDWTLVGRSGSMNSGRGISPGEDSTKDASTSATGERSAREASEAGSSRLQGSEPSSRGLKQRDLLDALHADCDQVMEDPTKILERAETSAADASIADPSTDDGDTFPGANGDDADVAIPTGYLAIPSLSSAEPVSEVVRINRDRVQRRRAAFVKCLADDVISIDELRPLAWAGAPDDLRPVIWMLLLGYLPRTRSVRAPTLARKRAEYQASVKRAFQRGTSSLDQAIWHQIRIDVPRTNPGIVLWQREATQRALERILYVWAIQHPASGYVQGINDLATPFFEVFLSAYITVDPEQYDVALLPEQVLQAVEADTFWCLSKLLEGIQDNYTEQQLGIQAKVATMGELVARMNPDLHAHFQNEGVEYMQIAFRWMNCLLMRELSVPNIVRLWDTYLADGSDAFSNFHVCVCAAFLNCWSKKLLVMDFQGIIMFLQGLPTQKWTAQQTEVLLADAFLIKSLFGGTAHLGKSG